MGDSMCCALQLGLTFLSLAPYHFFTNIAINKSIARKDCYCNTNQLSI